MPVAFDGLLLQAASEEIAAAVLGARLERVYQPEPLVVTLHFYRRGEEGSLLISCHPRFYRAHLTARAFVNPRTPSAFCMLLRKHLEGAVVAAVAQPGLDRVLHLVLERAGARLTLVAELMGKHSNLVLLDGPPPAAGGAQAPAVLDALKRIPASLSRHRQILPGLPYLPPPCREKVPLVAFAHDAEEAGARLAARWAQAPDPAWRRLVEAVDGPGPVLARELCLRAGLDPEAEGTAAPSPALSAALAELAADVASGRFRPTRAGAAFAAFPLPALAATLGVPQEAFPSVGALLDAVFAPLEEEEAVRGERQRLAQVVGTHLQRARSRLAAQEEERRAALGAEEFRLLGELLMAHLHLVRPGQTSVEVTDWYDPEQRKRTIPLDPRLGAAANAQVYFKKYARAKRALAAVEENLARTREEVAYLESVEAALEAAATRAELAEVAAELAETGYLKEGRQRRQARGTRDAAPASAPLACTSSDGYPILVGKNNRQNDHLTLRLAAPDDLWLHAREIPGSHVVVRLTARAPAPRTLDDLPRRTLQEAALLAAHFSKARRSSNVPVDYTFRRHVRKPRGARPGMVVYTDHRTVFVTPNEAEVARLLGAAPPAP